VEAYLFKVARAIFPEVSWRITKCINTLATGGGSTRQVLLTVMRFLKSLNLNPDKLS
jgi:hypothetical protein